MEIENVNLIFKFLLNSLNKGISVELFLSFFLKTVETTNGSATSLKKLFINLWTPVSTNNWWMIIYLCMKWRIIYFYIRQFFLM